MHLFPMPSRLTQLLLPPSFVAQRELRPGPRSSGSLGLDLSWQDSQILSLCLSVFLSLCLPFSQMIIGDLSLLVLL